ncbi:MAG: hypothetical protein IBX71_09965 [Candidatus Desulforudis sp.]|nr:hypothetical protein [Desulforudis sp.]
MHPLLARYDGLIHFDSEKQHYEDECLTVWEKGHITAVRETAGLRRHVLQAAAP